MSYGERSYHIKQFLAYTLNLFICLFIYFIFSTFWKNFLKKYAIKFVVRLSYSYDTLDNLHVFFCLEIFPSCFENDVYNFIDFLRSGRLS